MRKINYIIIFIIGLTSIPSWSKDFNRDYQIISQSENGLILEYTPVHFSFDTVIVDQRTYLKPVYHLASPVNEEGEPMLKARNFTLGIPSAGRPVLSVVSTDYIRIRGVRLLPVPVIEQSDEFIKEIHEEGEIYSSVETIPEKVAVLINPGFIRNQRVITLRISPVRYNPAENTVFLYNKIRVSIRFGSESSAYEKFKTGMQHQTIINRTLLNTEQAVKWRVSKSVKTSKMIKTDMSGNSYKIPIHEEGIYKITGKFLQENGVEISSIDPTTLKIFNNGGTQLPRNIEAERPGGILENPIIVKGTDDGSFDESDYIIFYGRGVSGWEFNNYTNDFEHFLHIYDARNIYFLKFNDGTEGRRIQTVDNSDLTGAEVITSARQKIFFENDENNLISGGIDWYGYEFSNNRSDKSYQLQLVQPILNNSIDFTFRFKGGTSHNHQFRISLDQDQFKTYSFYSTGERTTSASYNGDYENGSQNLEIEYLTSNDGARAYLDWYEVEYPCELIASDGQLTFFSPLESGTYTYQLTGWDTAPLALDVTIVTEIRQMTLESMENGWTFTDRIDQNNMARYYMVDESNYKTPSEIYEEETSQLRSLSNQADLLIITHEDFYDQAQQYVSHKQTTDSLTVFLCDIQDVYDEFSSGVRDAVAIRDFVKYAYENWSKSPSFLLLFGDGDYDYRNILSQNDNNWIPPFEYDGNSHNAARATDDWYTYVSGNDTYMDLAVGRFPVQTVKEAEAVVNKIIQYENDPVFDWWRNLFTLVGDDEFGGPGSTEEVTHITATERIAENIIPGEYDLKKIYLTEYPEVLSRKPAAKAALLEQINKGTVWVNYIGHGNRKVLAHERVFERDKDINKLENKFKHCFLYAATCHFGRYDKPDDQSGAEQLFNSTEGIGAIGTIAASRECSSTPNEALNELLLNELLNSDTPLRIGEAFVIAKNKNNYINNDEKYILFTDPSFQLGIPESKSIITETEPDTLKALDKYTVKGRIERNGSEWTGFKGTVYLRCFDSKKDIEYNNDDVFLGYSLPGNSIFRGQKEIQGSSFEFSFIIPKDISYGGTTARISTYIFNAARDGNGSRELLPVGGSSDLNDQEGPEINVYFKGYENFISGDMVKEDPELIASLVDDKSGINITEEIGHKIMLYVDDNEPVNITQNFQYYKDSYLAGSLQYTLQDLSEGRHTIFLKAWDNANNSSSKLIDFEIVPQDQLRIRELLNYPNPMQESTHFTFKLNKDAEIDIKIYTVSGKLVCSLTSFSGFSGFNMIPWDGRDEMGDAVANGVYLYKVTARSYESDNSGRKEKIGKLIIMR